MYPVPGSMHGVEGSSRHPRKLISFLFVFGISLLCSGFLLSMFVLQTCPSGAFGDCKAALKIIGPLLAVVGLVCIILAQSKAKGYLREVQLQDDQVYGFVFCRGNCQFAQFLVFGFLFLTSGMLISVLGIWIPGCSPGWHYQPFNQSNTSDIEFQDCGFLSVQTMGPLIVLIGLCFFVIAHIKKKQNLNLIQESSVHEEEHLSPESFQVTVGDTVMVFPPPPPPYFADCSLQTITPSLVTSDLHLGENPPPYHSTFVHQTQNTDISGSVTCRENELLHTLSGSDSPSETFSILYLDSDPSQKCKAKEAAVNNECILSSSPSLSYMSLSSSESSLEQITS
ncbi:transmembrane protein 171 [Paroedura picta]|uniref:transmembrane protein 171 n=1 Tax=Paroedura picta TaxID=143630 RepID=UPI0040579C9E